MSKFNFKGVDGNWYSAGVTNGSLWAKAQKGERKFMTEAELIANVEPIREAIAKKGSNTVTANSAIAKELGALASEVLGDGTEG